MAITSLPVSLYGTVLTSTPALTDPGLIKDGLKNYTVLRGRFCVNLSDNGYEFMPGDVVTLHPSQVKDFVTGGILGIIP
jgi:hypothetical protein